MLAHDLCSKVHQAFRARHNRIVVNHTVQNLAILTILLQHGFITSLTRGTTLGPSPTSFIHSKEQDRRIWADLKYRDDRAVLNKMAAISLPSRRVWMTNAEIRRFCTGRRVGVVKPLDMGEIAVLKVNQDWERMEVCRQHEFAEARDALALGLGGEVLCRAG